MVRVQPKIPAEVLKAYGKKDVASSLLGQGEINATFLLQSGETKFVLQRLSPIFSGKVVEDFDVVTRHMEQNGWEVPRIIPAATGALSVTDLQGHLWRMMTFILSDAPTALSRTELPYQACGELLARLHHTLGELSYIPQFKIPHFHETQYYAERLRELHSGLSEEDKPVASQILDVYAGMRRLPPLAEQLLHGDPRVSNILFRDGKPFTYIDFDTLMTGPVWIDLGDMLRSLAEDSLGSTAKVSIAHLAQVIRGYQKVAAGSETPDFVMSCMQAAQATALELAMRYMIDIVEDSYFTWDTTRFASRRASHLARISEQLRIYQALDHN